MPNTHTAVEVNQADYNAAQAFFRDDRTGLAVKFQLGAKPQALLEAFARHRIASTRTVDIELLEALRPFAAMAAAYDPEDDGDDDQDAWAYNARPTIGQLRRARSAITKAEAGQ